MIDLINPGNFEFFARYLLAGLIIIWTRSLFVVGERPRLTDALVEAVVLSLINQLTFLVLAALTSLVWSYPVPPRFSFFLEVLVQPACLGAIFGWNLAYGWNHALLRRMAMPVPSPIRRAYDLAFTQKPVKGYVIVTFADGTSVYGYFGANSLAATDASRSDIYLERIYDVDPEGQWFEKVPPRAALLSLAGMRSIEFLRQETTSSERIGDE